jgi:hypothetical protein
MPLLDLSDAPEHPLERLLWLTGVMTQAKTELNAEFQSAYFTARCEGMLKPAVDLSIHSRKQILAFTRHENERLGRQVRRWDD